MGGRLARSLRNFNLENRVHRQVGQRKPSVAPRHPSTDARLERQWRDHPEVNEVHNKNEELLTFLKNVYVDSKDYSSKNVPINETSKQLQEYRFPKVTLNHDPAGITQVPKGKLSIVEVLAVINNHKLHPEVWTAEKIAEDYSLELKDVKGLLEYFKPFEMKILPPKQKNKGLISTR
ncbi:NADH dehydrogenase [ubiquinone] 1 alpha subcomplex assembly factor 4 [Hemitrygon akajei]|uniref:NADH dehydrogenase [ubiquinone] 1 alpha subcomplex assembly factor 4 n=1 Tax=Hemitrygon akajei TaxID=2704970 RepID=UPI003BF946E5